MDALTLVGPFLVFLGLTVVPTRMRVPAVAYVIVAAALVAVNTVLNGPLTAAVSFGASTALLLFLILFGGLSSRRIVFGLCVAAAGVPVLQWWTLLPGVLLAAAVAAIKLRRAAGPGYVTAVSGETIASFTTAGTIKRGVPLPDLSRLPRPTPEEISSDSGIGKAQRATVPFLACQTIGMGVSLLAVTFMSII